MKRNEVFAKIEQIKAELVDNAFPSLFSKEDVQILFEHILDGLGGLEDEKPSHTASLQAIERKVKENVESVIDNFDIESIIELSIGWNNQIEMDINARELRNELEESIKDAFEEFNVEEEAEEVETEEVVVGE
jgi:hypothetical protein